MSPGATRMLCFAMPCCAMPCHAMPCYAMLCLRVRGRLVARALVGGGRRPQRGALAVVCEAGVRGTAHVTVALGGDARLPYEGGAQEDATPI